tara:strand:- start:208 stop:645 length:438 start_codon:yes stop_codon:yes gene_type:complete
VSSFSTAGGGAKPPTALLTGRRVQASTAGDLGDTRTGTLQYVLAAGTTADAVNVTGSGVWHMGFFQTDVTSTTATVTVTIDGVQVYTETGGNIITYGLLQAGAYFFDYVGNEGMVAYESIPFNKSLVINVSCDVEAFYYYNYYLT